MVVVVVVVVVAAAAAAAVAVAAVKDSISLKNRRKQVYEAFSHSSANVKSNTPSNNRHRMIVQPPWKGTKIEKPNCSRKNGEAYGH